MKPTATDRKRFAQARDKADAVLASGANRLLLIEAILIVCVFVALFFSLDSGMCLLLAMLTEDQFLSSLLYFAVSLLHCVLGIFFATPVVLGLFRLAEQMQAGNTPVLLDLFYYLSSGERYLHGLSITRIAIIKGLLMVLAANTIWYLCPISWLCNLLIAAVIILCTLWVLFPYSRLNSLLKDSECPVQRGGLRFVCHFLPWLLLGFLSIGLLLVLDVFPRMLLTYFCDCNRDQDPH